MATISGRILFDRTRTAAPPTGMIGINNVPVVLQNTATGFRLAVMTVTVKDADENDTYGNFSFINVTPGNYRVVEAYGTPAVASPGDFNLAEAGDIPSGVVPPISYIQDPPVGATNLDCTTPNTLLITVASADMSNLYICNGPVKYTPIVMDPSVSVYWATNYINIADEGSFGLFPAGTPVMTGADPNPYPNVNPDFRYVQPVPNSPYPRDGEYTIQNIATSITYQNNNVWWRIADYTTGNETGRMMIVNGDNPITGDNLIFFKNVVFIKPETYYLFVTWIINLIKITGRVDPALGIRILAPDGKVLYNKSVGEAIPINMNEPEWREVGTIIYSGDYSTLDVQFVSLGAAASGNDYAVDYIGLFEVDITLSEPIKSASPSTVSVGDTVNITVIFTNESDLPMTGIQFKDPLPDGLTFKPGSVTINQLECSDCDPNVGFALPDLNSGEEVEVKFEAIADYIPWRGIATNTATVNYNTPLVEGVLPVALTTSSNSVDIVIAPPECNLSFSALQRERSIRDEVASDGIIIFDTPLIAEGAIDYQQDGSIDITQFGVYIVTWFTAGMVGFATNGQLYQIKKYDYAASDWSEIVGASNHIKNSSTIGFAIINVTEAEINEYGKATIALFNSADANIKLSFFNPKAGILIYGANFRCIDTKIFYIEENLLSIANHIDGLEQFLTVSEVTEIWSETPELLGLGVAVISIGNSYNFWGIGMLDSDQVLDPGNNYYLIGSYQFSKLSFYRGSRTTGTLWIEDPILGLMRYPLRFDATGIYFVPSSTMNLSSGTQFSFTLLLIL